VTLTVISATNTYVLTVVADTAGQLQRLKLAVIVQYGRDDHNGVSISGLWFCILDGNDRDGGHSDANSDSTTVILASGNATVAAIFKPHLALDRVNSGLSIGSVYSLAINATPSLPGSTAAYSI